jgi:predicted dehydrogenase
MDNVSIGVIGCGKMARDLAHRCLRSGRCRIAAVYDPDPQALFDAAAELLAEPVRGLEELCARPDVDAVIVGSPPGAHLEGVLAAAAARKPVYCEKPLGISVAECDKMIAACRRAGVPLFVGHVLRLFPLFRQSLRPIADGVIGKPRAISVTRASYSTAFHSGWRAKRSLAGGLLLEVHTHELDYMRAVLGQPQRVTARIDNLLGGMEYEDQCYVLVDFVGGASGLLHGSMSSPVGEYRVHIQGTGGNMVHGGFSGSIKYQQVGGQPQEVPLGEISGQNPYDRELASWIDSLTFGTEPLFTGEDGRIAVAMAECAYRSAASGRTVALSEVLTSSG